MTRFTRTCLLALTLALAVTGGAFASVLEESMDAPRTRPLSRFDHDTHNETADLEESCALCHHLFDDEGELIQDESSEETACRECHDDAAKGVPKTEAAFHNRCKSCHLSVKSGPITCGQCHAAHQP
ncbi:cytochrome c3 family protein [Desulfoluna spongiiphila]|uniref:cytochrome c3 family protein n=1 Tax=Desulfoluna spongiiphila TaxID=419481 RepID=UPI00125983E0|nr:cytochrome c3 family protein [Desulfoluna spongiiphila]VVS91769.1 class iii cytochrome c [Desulfoluna spongiiphila]